ncbi:MAG: sigma-70 family RNA polymerase sigma factor [Deltaproteobacteria bacterium]|nr:sigma-70 family RNA polymerase sigma factor [Deltaproteobacteria bacterium]
MKDDAALVSEALAGSSPAWREIHARHGGVVLRVCQGFGTLSEAEVQDTVQDTFIRAHQRLGELRDPSRLRPWLLSIARSRALGRLARRASERRALAAFAADPAAGIRAPRADAREVERQTRIELVRELIDALPEGEARTTIELFYLEGELSAREIAERLGVGKSTVTMRLERFRARIKRRLAARLLSLEEA